MRQSQDIYNDIGSVLLSIAPDTAEKIILCATLDPESDCDEFTYDYVDKQGHQHWVIPIGYSVKPIFYACGVDKNIDVDSPAWGRGSSYPGKTTKQYLPG